MKRWRESTSCCIERWRANVGEIQGIFDGRHFEKQGGRDGKNIKESFVSSFPLYGYTEMSKLKYSGWKCISADFISLTLTIYGRIFELFCISLIQLKYVYILQEIDD